MDVNFNSIFGVLFDVIFYYFILDVFSIYISNKLTLLYLIKYVVKAYTECSLFTTAAAVTNSLFNILVFILIKLFKFIHFMYKFNNLRYL